MCEALFATPAQLEIQFPNFTSVICVETRDNASCFRRPLSCPTCEVTMIPYRIGAFETWVEKCASCENYFLQRQPAVSLDAHLKKLAREKAFQSFSPEERKEIAGGLKIEKEESAISVGELNAKEAMMATVGIPIINKVHGDRLALVTLALIFVNCALFGMGLVDEDNWGETSLMFSWNMGLSIRLVTSLFAHGGWLHLIGNVLFLYPYGDAIERTMRHDKFLAAYVFLGVSSMLVQTYLNPETPVVGASGAIAGLMGMAAVLQSQASLTVFLLRAVPIQIPLWLGIVLSLLYQAVMAKLNIPGIAWMAHVSGLIIGFMLGIAIKYFSRST
jgi:membrane associated rhomboid family serine protease